MGKFHPPFSFTGSVGNISVYTMRGSDTPIVRKKGGPTKKQIETRPSFATTRKNNKEFGGRARVTGQVLDILRPLKYLGDYNLAGPLNTLFKPIQELDTLNEHGKRNVQLTKNPGLLQGFNLNRRTPFETIIANRIDYTLSKDTLKASVTFPALIAGVNFFVPNNYSWYKFMVVLGTVEDMFYTENGYKTENGVEMHMFTLEETDWFTVSPRSESVLVNLTDIGDYINERADTIRLNPQSLLLGVGIAFGRMVNGQVEMIKYVGGAKILATA